MEIPGLGQKQKNTVYQLRPKRDKQTPFSSVLIPSLDRDRDRARDRDKDRDRDRDRGRDRDRDRDHRAT